jgi:hypothetical protein
VKYVVTIEVGDIEVSCEAGSKEEVLSGLDELIELSQKVSRVGRLAKPLEYSTIKTSCRELV